MLNRSNLFLVVILVIQAVLLAASVLVSSSNESRPVEAILRELVVDDVVAVAIADDVDASVDLARGEEGWVLPAADDFPVDGTKVDALLGNIAGLKTGRLVAANPANFSRLKVADDDFRRRIAIVSDSATHVLYLGGSAGADTVYARRGDENLVYLGAGMDAWDASTLVSNWIDAGYVDIPQADVVRIVVRNQAGRFEFLRDGETWIYQGLNDGETFDDSRMPSILRNAAAPPRIIVTIPGTGGSAGLDLEAILNMWEETLGLKVELQQVETATYWEDLNDGRLQAFAGLGWQADYPDPQNFLDILFHSESQLNQSGYSNPEVDRLLEAARVEQDWPTRMALYNEAEQLIVDDVPWIPLWFSGEDIVLLKPYVKGYALTPLIVPKLKDVYIEGR
jgi:hypothetical protein